MDLDLAVLPFQRMIPSREDFATMLTRYLEAHPSLGLLPHQHRADLRRLQELRNRVQQASLQDVHGEVSVEDLHEYYNYLLECETKGILGDDRWMHLEWESSLTGQPQSQGSLAWERANVIWNMATLEAWMGCEAPCVDKATWFQAATRFQNAASWLQHVPPTVGDSIVDFSDTFLEFWQALLVALAQRCVYESLACAARPRHVLLAKLAAAAVPLYGELEVIVQEDEQGQHLFNEIPSVTNTWADYARAWGMYMSSKAEYHQAIVAREKKEWGQEISRLDLASRFASLCLQYCGRAQLTSLESLYQTVGNDVKLLHDRMSQARHDNEMLHQQPVPQPKDLAEIRGEKQVKIDQPLTTLLLPMQGGPLFQGGSSETQDLSSCVEQFKAEMKDFFEQLCIDVQDHTQAAQTTLANANLPHSVTTYEMEQQGGGIPAPLWSRVEKIQQEGHIAKLKQDIWELRDVSEVAKTTFQKVQCQLDFDSESDKLFRKENPRFQGHDVEDIQRSFRQALDNYERLLTVAQEGDTILLRRLEQLDINPKYKLLQFQKSQLDRLLPGVGGMGQPYDTTPLRRLLVDLSKLIEDRENLVQRLDQDIQNYDIRSTLEAHTANGQDYHAAFNYAKSAFDGLLFEIRANFDKQSALLRSILLENDFFLQALDKGGDTSATDSCIAMIEDAIIEIKQLSSHMAEGKAFYDVIIPKLEKLKIQVGDVSARLTIERLEYDDQVNRNRQEAADAEMAKRMSSESTQPRSAPPPPPTQPVVTPPSPQVITTLGPAAAPIMMNVDDEKVAALVAMDFDPARVVAALRKHKNDVEQALNELLSC